MTIWDHCSSFSHNTVTLWHGCAAFLGLARGVHIRSVCRLLVRQAAKGGIWITNTSSTEPIVMLKHFAENPELDKMLS